MPQHYSSRAALFHPEVRQAANALGVHDHHLKHLPSSATYYLLKRQPPSLEPLRAAQDSCSTALGMEPAAGVPTIATSGTCS